MEPHLATFGIWELVVILLIVVVIFGAAKLPQLGGAFGKAIRNFRKSFKEEPREVQGEAKREEEPAKVEEAKQPESLPSGSPNSEAERELKEFVDEKPAPAKQETPPAEKEAASAQEKADGD
jgi:sec-independent protein translocase protein TatA